MPGSPTGSFAFRDSKTVTGCANNGSGLIRVTSTAHGLQTGDAVTISGIGGTTEANASWPQVTVINANTYDLVGSSFSHTFTSNGTAVVTGLYYTSITASAANGFERGKTFSVVASYQVSSSTYGQEFVFGVV
jgi:hypothetical protein